MAVCLWKACNTFNVKISSNLCGFVRCGHTVRGKPPEIARNLAQRLAELKYKDPKLHYRVDIGLPHSSYSRSVQLKKRLEYLKTYRNDNVLEATARNKKLAVNLDEVKEEWLKTAGPYQIKQIADHYDIFSHLFVDAYFVPRVPLTVLYNYNNSQLPVYYGNVLKPVAVAKTPEIKFPSDDNALWTLILTNPDGHFTEQNSEYVHWFVGNIPGNDISKGETVIEYLQAFPPKGTGYHRFIFVLYKQTQRMDYSKLQKEGSCLQLSERTFKTLDFYRERQDDLTPAGLAFFQSDWDSSLIDFYHNVLDMKVPIFEYDFAPVHLAQQKWFPLRQPFNLYMDKHRDQQQINKEFLIRKLKKVHPFKADPPPVPFPNAEYFEGYVPSWLKLEKTKTRMKWGRINEIE